MIQFDSEKELEDWFMANQTHPGVKKVIDVNYAFPQTIASSTQFKRQVRLGEYGICDIVVKTEYLDMDCPDSYYPEYTLIELKNRPININDVFQVLRYIRGIQKFRETEGPEKAVLIAPSVKTGDWLYILNVLDSCNNLEIYTYSIVQDGDVLFTKFFELGDSVNKVTESKEPINIDDLFCKSNLHIVGMK